MPTCQPHPLLRTRSIWTWFSVLGGVAWLAGLGAPQAAEAVSTQAPVEPAASDLDLVPTSPAYLTPSTDGPERPDGESGNIRVGAATIRVLAGLSTAFSDNINYSEFDRKSDIIISPNVEFNLIWPVSTYNTLSFDIGASYDKYLNNPEADSNGLIIAPDSEIQFRMGIGKHVTLTFYDRFGYQQTPLDDPTISNTVDYGRFTNDLGYTLVWEVNREIEYENGYYWSKWISLGGDFDYLDRDSHNFINNFKYKINPALEAGIKSHLSLTEYEGDFQNDSMMLRIGPFVRAKVTENTEVGAELTYVFGSFDAPTGPAGDSNLDTSDADSVNGEIDITNRINRHMNHRLVGGYETRLGTTTNFYDLAFARYTYNWQMSSPLSFNFNAFYEYGVESGDIALLSEDFHRYGAGIGFAYRLTRSIVTRLNYDYIQKDSNLFGGDYYQNRITLDFQYRF